jgi:hypothetical protein
MLISGPSKRQSLQIPKRNTETWSSDQDELADPFAEIDDDFSLGEDDLESQLLRDKRATLCSSVGRIVDLLEPSTPSNQLKEACDELVSCRTVAIGPADNSWGSFTDRRTWVLKSTS